MARMVPNSVKVKTGEVIDSRGGHSPQSDALITSVDKQPSLFAQTEEILHPIESVLLVVEVKSTMTKGEVDDFQRKVQKFRGLHHSKGYDMPLALLGYQCGTNPSTLAKWILQLPEADQPDFFCVVEAGVFGRKNGDSFDIRMFPATDDDGAVHVISDPTTRATLRRSGRKTWPAKGVHDLHVEVDAGRALLLFNERLLAALGAAGAADSEWLGAYVSPDSWPSVVYSLDGSEQIEVHLPQELVN